MPTHPARSHLSACLMAVLLTLQAPLAAAQSAVGTHIVCQADISGETRHLTVHPGTDPFERVRHDFDNGHRVAAQWLKTPDRLRTFVYDNSKNRAVLISTQTVPVQSANCSALVLDTQVYTGSLEREANLSCTLMCGE